MSKFAPELSYSLGLETWRGLLAVVEPTVPHHTPQQAGPGAGRGETDKSDRRTAAPREHVRLQENSEDVQVSHLGVAVVRSQA